MFTARLQNVTTSYNNWILLSFLIFLCFERISSTNTTIDQACMNGLTITLAWRNNTPYISQQQNSRVQGILVELLQKAFHLCCDDKVQLQFNNIKSVGMDLTNQSIDHGVIPVSRLSYQALTAYGRPFVGLVDAPGIAVITQSSVPGADLLMAILDSWPILIFIITTISLSGVVIWFLDYRKNPAHFPAYFPMGVFEGFWWAAVTMTTVGYGDRVPKSVCGRLFAVVWINAGLVILAMFMGIVTASLTSSMIDVNHFWGTEVGVINGSAEYQYAILQSASVHGQTNYEDMYSLVSSGILKAALVDQYTAASHQDYYFNNKLTITTITDTPVVYGIVLPTQGSQTIERCLRDYSESYQVESYLVISKYIAEIQRTDISDGTEYFCGSLFGYSVYAMTGMFLAIMGIGVWWQFYWKPRHGEWHQSKDTANKEIEMLPSSQFNGFPKLNHITHVQTSPNHPLTRPHCSWTQQCMGTRQLLDEYREYEKSWTKKFHFLQEKHRREQIEVFNLDNDGYNM